MFQRMDVSKMLETTGKKSVVMVIFIVFPKKKVLGTSEAVVQRCS